MEHSYNFEIEGICRGHGYVTASSEKEAEEKILNEEWDDVFDYEYDAPRKILSLELDEDAETE